jgi:hypothetical protein
MNLYSSRYPARLHRNPSSSPVPTPYLGTMSASKREKSKTTKHTYHLGHSPQKYEEIIKEIKKSLETQTTPQIK